MEKVTNTRERAFGIDELFYSATDPKGFIRSANVTFGEIAGYSPDEYLGAAHSLVRHPDMPRVVFRTMWHALRHGRPVAAYVKNRAKDGTYYWVLALAFPVDNEFMSVRLKPTSDLLPKVVALYEELLALEAEAELTSTRAAGMDISNEHLLTALHSLGYANYDDFMRHGLTLEVAARRAVVGSGNRRCSTRRNLADHTASSAFDACCAVGSDLDELAAQLDAFERLATEFRGATGFLADLAAEVGLFALNAGLSADRAGMRSGVLQAIANLMRIGAKGVETDVMDLSKELAITTTLVRKLAFDVAASALSLEMSTSLLGDLDTDTVGHQREAVDTSGLMHSVVDNLSNATEMMCGLDAALHQLMEPLRHLLGHLGELRILRLRAEIDAAGDTAASQFAAIIKQVEAKLAQGVERVKRLSTLTAETRHDMRSVDRATLDRDIVRLRKIREVLAAAPVG